MDLKTLEIWETEWTRDDIIIQCCDKAVPSPPVTLNPVDQITPNPINDDTHTGDGGWVLVVGGLGALGAAAVVAIRKMQNQPKKEGEKPRTTYILQLSKDKLSVSTSKKDSFSAKVWIVDETGQYAPVPSAHITVSPRSAVDGLVITPGSGIGSVDVTISLSKPVPVKSAELLVRAQAGPGGKEGIVSVQFEPELRVGFE